MSERACIVVKPQYWDGPESWPGISAALKRAGFTPTAEWPEHRADLGWRLVHCTVEPMRCPETEQPEPFEGSERPHARADMLDVGTVLVYPVKCRGCDWRSDEARPH